MYAVYRPLERSKMMAPVAWFNETADAEDYAKYLRSKGIDAEVIYNPDQYIEGDDSAEAYDLLGESMRKINESKADYKAC